MLHNVQNRTTSPIRKRTGPVGRPIEILEDRTNPVALIPLGNDFLAAPAPGSTQQNDIQLAVMPNGTGFVTVYESDVATPGTLNLYYQLYNANWQAIGSAAQVDSSTSSFAQVNAEISIDNAGNFVIAWETENQLSANSDDIDARQFGPTGTPLGASFVVDSPVNGIDQVNPSVSIDPTSGKFVIAWGDDYGGFLGNSKVLAHAYTSDTAVPAVSTSAGIVEVNTTGLEQFDPGDASVAMRSDGSYVVAYDDINASNNYDTFVRRIGANGSPLDASDVQLDTAFPANTSTDPTPRVAVDSSGNYVVVWESDTSNSGGPGIVQKRFLANGTLLNSSETLVSTAAPNDQQAAVVSVVNGGTNDGQYVVGWQSLQDGSSFGVYYRQFASITGGAATSGEVQINSTTSGPQENPTISVDQAGDLVAGFEDASTGVTELRLREFAAPQVVTFAAASESTPNASGTVPISLTRTGAAYVLNAFQTATVTVSGGTAVSGTDYSTSFPVTVNFGAGTSGTLNIATLSDPANTSTRTLTTAISTSGGTVTVGAISTNTLTINGTPPYVYGDDLTNNALTITQVAAGSDALTLSLSAGTYTLTDTGGLFFAPPTGNDAADISGGGTATITVPSADVTTIMVTLGTGTNSFTLTGTDAAAAPISVNTGSNAADTIAISGAVSDSGDVSLTSGGTITTSADLTANGAGSVSLTAATSIAVNGNITGGTGGTTLLANGTGGGGNTGVTVNSGFTVTATGAGPVSVTGTGGSGASLLVFGVYVTGTITSGVTGTVTVTGTGGSGGLLGDSGVAVSGGMITSGGTGMVTVTGTGGGSGTSDDSDGISLVGGTITSGGGTIQVTGTGGPGSGGSNYGVLVDGTIVSPNTTLNVTGNVGASTTVGINLDDSGTAISAGSGNVTLTSTGSISETSPAIITTTGTLTTSSVGGTLLADTNAVGSFNATNTTSGNISLLDAITTLTVTGVTNTVGTVTVENTTGNIDLTGAVTAGTNAVTLTSDTGAVTDSGGVTVTGLSLTASAATTIGISNAFPLITAVGQLQASALTGIWITNTGTLTIMGTGVQSTTSGPVNLTSTGNITLSAPITGTGTINLTSTGGNITDAAAKTVTGNKLNVSAVAGVAISGATSIVTAVNQLQASGGTVGVWVTNTGTSAPANLTIVGSGVQASGGPIILTTVGTLSETTAGAYISTTGTVVHLTANSILLNETTSAGTTVTLNITGTAGTVTDNGPITGTSATINAPAGTLADTINLNDLNGTPFTVTGGGQTGLALNIDDSGNAADTTYTISGTQITTSLPQTINYSGLSAGTLTLTTGSGNETISVTATAAAATTVTASDGINTFTITGTGLQASSTDIFNGGNQVGNVGDTFDVTPSTTATITVNGNGPAAPASPGDTLAVDAGGLGATVTMTTVSVPGDQPITYATIETVTLTNAGPIMVSGGNTLTLNATGPTSGNYQIDSGEVVNFTGATSFTWNGGAGTDTETINSAGGTLDVPITYTASVGGASTLLLEGGNYASGTNTATGAGAGTLQYKGGTSGNSGLITYSNLSPVQDINTVTNYTIDTFGSPDTINVVNGPIVGGFQTDEVNSTPDGTFELTDFANITNLTVIGTDNDTATVNYTTPAVGLATLTVEAAPTANVLATPATVATTINSPGNNSTVTIGNAGLLSGIQGPVTVLNTLAFTTLVIDDSADATPETASLTTTVIGGFTYGTLTGLGMGPSAFINYSTLDPTFGSFAGTPSVTINAGTGADTILVDQTAPAGNQSSNSTTINTNTGADTVNIQATSANEFYVITAAAGATADTVNIGSLAPTVSGGTLTGINGEVQMNFATGTTALTIDDSGDGASRTATFGKTTIGATTYGQVSGLGNPAEILYSGLTSGTLTVNAGSGGDTLNVNATLAATTIVTAGDGINTFDITGSGLQASSTDTFNGGNQAGSTGDTFNVTPSTTASITVNGNLPAAPASPGDTLSVNTLGAGASVTPTQIDVPGYQPITYATIETIDLIGGPVVVTGGNNLVLNATGATSGNYQLDSGPVVNFTGITSFTWNGGAGTDTMTINNAGGTLTVPITYTGSVGGANTLLVEGGSYASGVNTATGAGAGTLQYIGGTSGNSGLITYSNLSPVQDTTTVANYTINTFGSPDTINVVNGPIVSGFQTDEVNSTPDDTFELTDFANKTNVTVIGTGNDTATIDYTTAAVGLATLTVEANPTINVLETPATVATTINSATSSSVSNVTIGDAGLLSGIQGSVTVLNSPDFTVLVIDDSADATAQTASLTTTVVGGITYGQLTGLGMGASAFIDYAILDPAFGSIADVPTVTINAGTASDTILVDQTAPAGTVTVNTTTINTNTGADTVNIQATSANESYFIAAATGSTADTVNIGSLAPTVSGGTLANINGSVQVDNASGTTALTIDDSGDGTSQSATLGNTVIGTTTYGQLTGLGNPAAITYAVSAPQAVNSVTINTSDGVATTVLIDQTAASDTPFTTEVHYGNMFGTGDTANIQATGANISYLVDIPDMFPGTGTVNIGSLAPTTTGGTLTGIQGPIQIFDIDGPYALTMDDSGDATGRTATLDETTIGGIVYGVLEAGAIGLGNAAPIEYEGFGVTPFTLNGGPGGNTITVDQPGFGTFGGSVINPGTGTNTINIEELGVQNGDGNNYTINGQVNGALAAANTINLGLANSTQGINATVTVQGTSPATEVINLNDQADPGNDTIHVTSTQVGGGAYLGAVTSGGPFGTAGPGGLLNYDGTTTTLDINAGTGANTFNIDSTGATGTASPAGTTITNGTTAGLSTWEINGHGLTGANVFTGSTAGGIDQFTLNTGPGPGGFGPGIAGTSVLIDGGAAIGTAAYTPPPATPSGAAPAADTLTINGISPDGGPAPPVTDTLTSSTGGGNFTGLGTTVTVNNIAQESFVAAPGADTSFTLADATPGGAAGSITTPQTPQDGIVIAPTGPQSARAVLDNGPTAFSPVVYVSNIDGTFTVNGNPAGRATNDTLAVVGPSDGANGGIGGAPYYEPTTPSSASTITLSASQVSINNAGLGGALLPVNITTVSFAALFVIGGNQAGPVGDTFIATPSAILPIFVNGENPPAGSVPGDTLILNATGIAQLYQDPNDPTQLKFEDAATSGQITFTNIETILVTSAIHRLDILGDLGYGASGGAADSPMQDTVDITGTTPPGGPGPDTFGAGTGTLNGLAFGFEGISDLRVTLGQAPGHTQDDAVSITPYATSVNPWGTSVTVNEGQGPANTLTYVTAPGITNNTDLLVTGAAAGNVDATGIGSGTSNVVVRFSNAQTVTVNDGTNAGAFGDTLAIDLANGNTSDTVDFQYADPTGHTTPDITLLNTLTLASLLQVNMDSTDITALTVNGDATTDTFNVFDPSLPAGTSLPISLILNGGFDTDNYNTLTINGATGGPNTFFNVAGANPTSGIAVDLNRAVANYTNIQDPTFVGGGGFSQDNLSLSGSGTLSVTGTGPGAGTATITGQSGISFSNFGLNSSINLTGTGGSDVFTVSQPVGWGIGHLIVTESPSSATATLQVVGTSNSDTFSYIPSSGTITVYDGADQTNYTAAGIDKFAVDGAAGADNELNVNSYLPGNASLPSGTLGTIPQISYQNFQSIQVGNLPSSGPVSAGPVNAGTPVNIAVNSAVNVNTGSQPYTVVITVPPTDGTAVVNPASLPGTPFPTITYTPNTNFFGTDTLSYVVYDANGQVSQTPGVITISVLGIAHTPTVAVTNIQPVSENEGSPVPLDIVGTLSPSANAAEVLSYTISNVPANATFNKGTNTGGGIWTFTQAQLAGLTITDTDGPATLHLIVTATSTVTAGVGGATAGEIAAAPANTATSTGVPLSVTVNVLNVAPTATIGNNGPVIEGSPVTVSLTNPSDPSGPDTTAGFHYSFALLPSGLLNSYSSASTSNSATFTFAHYGIYTVYGQIIDQDGGFTDYSTTVTVQAIAHAPTVTVTSPVSEVLGNAVPISITVTPSTAADPNEVLTYQITGVPATASFNHGTNDGGGTWTFVAADLNGLTFTAGGGPGAIDMTVSVTSSVNSDVPADQQGPAALLTATTTEPLTVNVSVESIYAVGAGPGGAPVVHVYNPSGNLIGSFYAYDPNFRGGVTVAVGDINGDGFPDIITGTGPGGGPNVKVFDGRTFQQIDSFMAFTPDFRGGVNVAVGDLTGNGQEDIVVGAGTGGGPVIQVFSGPGFTTMTASFFAYNSTFRGGVNVAVADVNNSGHADIIAGAGNGGGPQVEVFDGQTHAVINSFFAYGSTEQGGVNVAAGDLYGNGNVEIVTGPGIGGGATLNVFNALTGGMLQSITAFGPDPQTGLPLTNGLTVAVEGLAGGNTPVILAGTGPDYSAEVSILNASTLTQLNVVLPFSGPDGVDFNGGVYVG
jgi:hypothetical protein